MKMVKALALACALFVFISMVSYTEAVEEVNSRKLLLAGTVPAFPAQGVANAVGAFFLNAGNMINSAVMGVTANPLGFLAPITASF